MENAPTKVQQATDSIKQVIGDTFDAVNKFSNTKIGLAVYAGLIWKFFGQEIWHDVGAPAVRRLAVWTKLALGLLLFNWIFGFRHIMDTIFSAVSYLPAYFEAFPEHIRIPMVVAIGSLTLMSMGLVSTFFRK